VYAWIYADPVRFVTFIDGKKIDYAVLDGDLTRWNERQRDQLFWEGLPWHPSPPRLLYYYLFAKE